VTENDLVSPSWLVRGKLDDPVCIVQDESHPKAARLAIAKGGPLNGYVLGSLQEHYDRSLRQEMSINPVHVDFGALARTPKASYHAMNDALT